MRSLRRKMPPEQSDPTSKCHKNHPSTEVAGNWGAILAGIPGSFRKILKMALGKAICLNPDSNPHLGEVVLQDRKGRWIAGFNFRQNPGHVGHKLTRPPTSGERRRIAVTLPPKEQKSSEKERDKRRDGETRPCFFPRQLSSSRRTP